MTLRSPISNLTDALFPYPTLLLSAEGDDGSGGRRPLRLSQPVGRDRRDPHRLPDLVRRPRPESPPLQGEGWVGMGFPSAPGKFRVPAPDRKSTRLNSSH